MQGIVRNMKVQYMPAWVIQYAFLNSPLLLSIWFLKVIFQIQLSDKLKENKESFGQAARKASVCHGIDCTV